MFCKLGYNLQAIAKTILSQSASSVFFSHQISTSHLPPASQQYFSLTTNQHQPPANRTRH
jgi:hypothetical protein